MKKILLSVLLLFLSGTVWAQGVSVIQLRDGSAVIGEVVEMKDGVYTIQSATIGKIQIPATQIVSIKVKNPVSSSTSSPAPAVMEGYKHVAPARENPVEEPQEKADTGNAAYERAQQEANSRVNSMMMEGDFSEKVMGLDKADSMQEVLGDEETMNAIRNFDYESLMNNEKMKKLMESSEIRDLLGDAE
jgi:hypothetical protein